MVYFPRFFGCFQKYPKIGVQYPKMDGKNNGTKWMVKIMENLSKMDDLGVPLFLETPIRSRLSVFVSISLSMVIWGTQSSPKSCRNDLL